MKISRRHLLAGLGGTLLGLPFLESFRPRQAKAQAGTEPYAIFFRQAAGVAAEQSNDEIGDEPERFWPHNHGPITADNLAGRALDELTDHASRLLIVDNINMEGFDYADGHARGALQGLTARGPVVEGAGGDSEADGESIDHRIGRELNTDGRDSLFLYAGHDGGWLGGACISYRSSNQRRAAIRDPWNAYQTIAGNGVGLSPQEAAQLASREKSINDLLRAQMQDLMSSSVLSSSDRQRLELHFNSIRETEVALACRLAEDQQQIIETGSSVYDSNDGENLIATTKLHMDVAALAIACGYTRSVAIQFGNGNDGSTRHLDPDTGQRLENYHYITHRRLSHDSSGDVIPNSDVLHHKIDRYFGDMFKYLVDRLAAYSLPNGQSLVDAGVSVWYNDNGNGPGHSSRRIPYVIAGSAGGFLKQGEYLRTSTGDGGEPNHSRMLNTLASAAGVRKADGSYLDDFGDPSFPNGIIDDLLA